MKENPAVPLSDAQAVSAGARPPQLVPAKLWFVWFGSELPLFARLALRSALRHNPEAQVTLLHAGLDAAEVERWRDSSVQLRAIDEAALANEVSAMAKRRGHAPLAPQRLLETAQLLRAPAARSNWVRLMILYAEGGVYLDTDTLTLRELTPLRGLRAFCGREQILWSQARLNWRKPYYWSAGPALSLARWAAGVLPRGYRLERRLQRWYTSAVNNAVMGFQPGHPALHRALELACQFEAPAVTRRFGLGTHLLQQVCGELQEGPDAVCQLAPEHFYPLGPVVSQHYFREVNDVASVMGEVFTENTYVVHWYASVSDLNAIDAARMRRDSERTVYAQLCAPYLD